MILSAFATLLRDKHVDFKVGEQISSCQSDTHAP